MDRVFLQLKCISLRTVKYILYSYDYDYDYEYTVCCNSNKAMFTEFAMGTGPGDTGCHEGARL